MVTCHKLNDKNVILPPQKKKNNKKERLYINIFDAVFLFVDSISCSKRVTYFTAEIAILFFLLHHFHLIRVSQVFGISLLCDLYRV